MSLTGRRILVTGGTGKLGTALAKRLIDEGAWVAVTYRSNPQLAALLAEFDPAGPQPVGIECELSDPDSVDALADELAQREALPLHGLALLAGGWRGGEPLWESPQSLLDDVVRDNVTTAWNVLRRFTGGMVEAGYGRIVTVGARHSLHAVEGSAAYAAAKGALASLTSGLAEDLRGTGVTAACVLPWRMGHRAAPGTVTFDEVASLLAWLLDEDGSVANGDLLQLTGPA